MDWGRAFTALVTPFRGEVVDHDRLAALVDRQVEAGIGGLVPCGTTGESPTLSHEEHRAVIHTVVEAARGRVPVVAGAGSNSTREAVELVRFSAGAGSDGVLVITPYYNKPTQEGLYRHFVAVAETAGRLPVVLYNVPGRTGVNLLPATVARIRAAAANVEAIKEASGNLDQASEILARTDVEVLSGDDSLTLPLLAVGASGVISVASNVVPDEVEQLVRAWHEGDPARARQAHHRLFPLFRALFLETNPIPVKWAMAHLGWIEEGVRLPLAPPSRETADRVAEALSGLGLAAVPPHATTLTARPERGP
ncbi:MAG: 4-hydroxy-tetrahydrodipicolinate synthase [Planctomycetes bacterium]|nr:4-hydroxy-tetrahydrodipicolinate synthase [Planctomycetota bacterium]